MSHFYLLRVFPFFLLSMSLRFPTIQNSAATNVSKYSKPEETSQLQVFLNSLILQGFSDSCKLIIISNSYTPGSSDFIEISDFTLLLQQISTNYFHFAYSNQSFSLKSHTVARYPSLIANHFKRSGHCFIVILLISKLKALFLQNTKAFLSPVFIPLVRKNENYFIFITKPHLIENLLISHEYPQKIKLKIAVAFTTNGSLLIKTHCFFCDPASSGSSSIITLGSHTKSEASLFPDFTKSLNGALLRVSVPLITSRLEIDASIPLNNAKRGLCKYLFDDFLKHKLNFTYTMFVSSGNGRAYPAGGTGVKLSNGEWTGVVGDIINGKADLGVMASLTVNRIRAIGTTDTFYDSTFLTFVTAKGIKSFSPAFLLKPFDILSWTLIVSAALLSFIFLKMLLSRISLHQTNNTQSTTQPPNRSIWLFLLGTFLGQDCPSFPQVWSVRIFISMWMFFVLIMSSVFRSKLVGLMAIPNYEDIPKTFAELVFTRTDYGKGFLKRGDNAYNTLSGSTDPVYAKLVAEMTIHQDGTGVDCINLVFEKKYACIGYDYTLNYIQKRFLQDHSIRELATVADKTYNDWNVLNFEGHSILKRSFERALRLVRPMHLQQLWDDKDVREFLTVARHQDRTHYEKIKKRNEEHNDSFSTYHPGPSHTLESDKDKGEMESLHIMQISGAFTSGLVGLLVAIFVFLIEIVRSRLQRVLRSNQQIILVTTSEQGEYKNSYT